MPLLTEEKQSVTIEVTGFKCDICKQEFQLGGAWPEAASEKNALNFLHIKHQFGYQSKVDGAKIELTICEPCLQNLCTENGVEIKNSSF